MKILNKIWGTSLLALLLIVGAPHKSNAQQGYISDQDFYDELAPYGTWVNDPQYGDVWIPDVAGDFRPYRSGGHWVLTDYGNTWVSEYPWGWATFHYGRWRYDDFYGWEWIPGHEWAPAWVSWRHGGGYYGWAPLTPGVSISLSFGSSYRAPYSYWAFAPEAYINRANINNYYVPHTQVVNIINRTTVVNNIFVRDGSTYIAGPRAAEIQRYTHQRPQVYAINNAARPGTINVQNNTVNIFRPTVKQSPDARPERVVDGNAYKQQNPNQGIARRGAGGAAGFNHDNAIKLANVARNANSNTNVVHVNSRPNNDQQANRSNSGQQPSNQPVQLQPQPVQQPTFSRGDGHNDNRPAQPGNDIQQKQQQIHGEQKALHEQKRDEYRREQQLQNIPQIQSTPPINGQTPIEQQQEAIRGQRRQLQMQQAQQQQTQQAQQQAQRVQQQQQTQQSQQQRGQVQQVQREQQHAQEQQQVQPAQQQQVQQQRGQAQQVQRDQQRTQQQQQAQQAQRDQQQAQQQQTQQQAQQQRGQAQQAQRDQQRAQQQQQIQQKAQPQRPQQQKPAQPQQPRPQRRPPELPAKPVNQ